MSRKPSGIQTIGQVVMADENKMERTWLCSVVFMDIVQYSSQSVELQMKWKKRFNDYLTEAIHDEPESERVILDTGDGAAICFLGAPEAAMFAALRLCRAFAVDERELRPGLRVRLGINLGPVRLVRDVNGALNAIGDGINAGQRIMSFAAANHILVSQSFFEVVSRLSDDYKALFRLKGVERDKHVREHTVYHLVPPQAERAEGDPPKLEQKSVASIPEVANLATGGKGRSASPGRSIILVGTIVALIVLTAAAAWHFHGSAVPATPAKSNAALAARAQTGVPVLNPSTGVTGPPHQASEVSHPNESISATDGGAIPAANLKTKRAQIGKAENALRPRSASSPSKDAKTAYHEALVLLDQHKAAKAARRFDDALRASPDYLDAYIGRAQARRGLGQYELSLEDCNKVIRIRSDDPRGYNCRGYGYELLKQPEPALRDFNKAISLNPNFAQAWADRGSAYSDLQQYDRALQDYNQALRLRPENAVYHLRRAAAYHGLKQYKKAIEDETEAIRLQPDDLKAYVARASSEELSGDAAGAAADRQHIAQSGKRK